MKTIGLVLLGVLTATVVLAEDRGAVGRFSVSGLEGWQTHEFAGRTEYRLVTHDGRQVLRAHSRGSASALVYRGRIDLRQTPYLNWSWRTIQPIDPGDEKRKAGDDFVARVYVVRDGGVLFWKTRALNYVWSFDHARGEAWDNPFAGDKARMVSLRDANDPVGEWQHERRHVARDLRDFLGEDYRYIDGIAIMTDTDNSGLEAIAEYGDIWFSAGPAPLNQ